MTLRQLIVSAVLLTSSALTHAIEFQPDSAAALTAALAAAQKADKPGVLQLHADWSARRGPGSQL